MRMTSTGSIENIFWFEIVLIILSHPGKLTEKEAWLNSNIFSQIALKSLYVFSLFMYKF